MRASGWTGWVVALLVAGCAPTVRDGAEFTSSSSSSSSSSGAPPRTAYLPVAPTAGDFMWQGVAERFVDKDMQPCDARVAIASGDQATCFVGANGDLYCAGQISTTDYGSTFVDTGLAGAQQILMSPTFDTANHDSACAVVAGKGAICWGSDDDQGEFGDGTTTGSETPEPWGMGAPVERIATGTWDQICGLTGGGDASCAGDGFGTTPAAEGTGATSLWVDTEGMVHVDDATVWRAPNSRTECQVGATGYVCGQAGPFGDAGAVVDGTVQAQDPMNGRACWLQDDGSVTCTPWTIGPPPPPPPITAPMFQAMPVLAISGNFYSDAICAVYDDGSIACVGTNAHGELGTGNTNEVTEETIVAPPGTIDVTCK